MPNIFFKNTHLMQRLNFSTYKSQNFTQICKTDFISHQIFFCEVILKLFTQNIYKIFIIFCKIYHIIAMAPAYNVA